jgi:parallel beta-helix repeat protein
MTDRKEKILISILLIAILFVCPSSLVATAKSNPCTVTVNGENGPDNAIQSAINANPGATICVAGGVYPEQLTITSSGTQLVGLGTFLHPTIIQPTSVTINSPAGVYPLMEVAAIILVGSSSGVGSVSSITGVVIKNLDVDGMAASSSSSVATVCEAGGGYIGIFYVNAGGTIANNVVNGMIAPPAIAAIGCGNGVDVHSEPGQTATVSITSNTVSNYGSIGIVCYGSGSTCSVSKNIVSFYKPYESLTISFGILMNLALATVDHNIVSNNICTAGTATTFFYPGTCGPNGITQYQSTGIYTIGAASGTTISGNIVIHSDSGIAVSYDTTQVVGNIVVGSTYFAIVQYDGAGTYMASNNIVAGNPIGFYVANDGGVPSFTSTIGANVFGSDPIKIQIQALSPGSVTLTYASQTYTVSGTTTKNIY